MGSPWTGQSPHRNPHMTWATANSSPPPFIGLSLGPHMSQLAFHPGFHPLLWFRAEYGAGEDSSQVLKQAISTSCVREPFNARDYGRARLQSQHSKGKTIMSFKSSVSYVAKLCLERDQSRKLNKKHWTRSIPSASWRPT